MEYKDIAELPKLILGGTVLSEQYNQNPKSLPLVCMLKLAFKKGFNAIDTSPYYGESETIYGNALEQIKDEFPRSSYFICTKVGRIELDKFNYSPEHIRFSVIRSCERLKTSYLDLVYLHDVEFVEIEMIFDALRELKCLKEEGIINNFGLSGYPVEFLQYVSEKCVDISDIGPLDAVLSYCHLNLQNTKLLDYHSDFFQKSKIKVLSNGSILSMSLLRSAITHEFHPGSQELHDCANRAAKYTLTKNIELADLATRYALSKWLKKGPTILGVSNMKELEHALQNFETVINNNGKLTSDDEMMVRHIQENIFGSHMNETWKSGITHITS